MSQITIIFIFALSLAAFNQQAVAAQDNSSANTSKSESNYDHKGHKGHKEDEPEDAHNDENHSNEKQGKENHKSDDEHGHKH